MSSNNTAERMIESFNRGFFPEPYQFSTAEINAIASIPGTDANGTFADAPMERSLILTYDLQAEYGEHTWPGFAGLLRQQKAEHFEGFSPDEIDRALNRLNEAIAGCLSMGIPGEQISEQMTGH